MKCANENRNETKYFRNDYIDKAFKNPRTYNLF